MSDDAASASGSIASKAEQVDIVKARLCALRDRRPTKAVRAEMALAERELDALVNAPVSGGRDPFEWLPDELVVMIIERMPFESVWRDGACERVCLRWVRLMKSAPIEVGSVRRGGDQAARARGAHRQCHLSHGGVGWQGLLRVMLRDDRGVVWRQWHPPPNF
jgi:hypothetical protein